MELIERRVVGCPSAGAGKIRIARFRELRPVTDHCVRELLLLRIKRSSNNYRIHQILNFGAVVCAQWKTRQRKAALGYIAYEIQDTRAGRHSDISINQIERVRP